MIRVLFLSFIAIFFASSTQAQKKLVFSTHNTAINWVCSQILTEAYQKLGIEVHIEKYPSKRALLMSNSGKVDGEVCRVKGIETHYKNLIRVPLKIQSSDAVVFTKKTGLEITGWDDLKPHKIGILRGAELAKQNTTGMNVHSATNIEQLFLMLDKERVELVVMERIMGLTVIKKLELEGIHVIEPPLVKFDLYHYLHKQHATMIPALVQVLQEMSINRIEEIHNQLLAELE